MFYTCPTSSFLKKKFENYLEENSKGIEKNFSKIPNDLLEVLARTKLSNYEWRCIMVIFRKTLGWHKKEDYISLSQFEGNTGIQKSHVWRTLKRLEWRKIIRRNGKKISINFNYQEWRELPRGAIVTKSGVKVANSGKKVANLRNYKKYFTKEIKQKKENSFSFKEKTIKELGKEDFLWEGSFLKDKFGNKWKPYFKNYEMRWAQGKWWVLQNGEWLEFAGSEKEIEWRNSKNREKWKTKTWP